MNLFQIGHSIIVFAKQHCHAHACTRILELPRLYDDNDGDDDDDDDDCDEGDHGDSHYDY